MLEPVCVVSEPKVWTLNVAAIVERTVGVTRRWCPVFDVRLTQNAYGRAADPKWQGLRLGPSRAKF